MTARARADRSLRFERMASAWSGRLLLLCAALAAPSAVAQGAQPVDAQPVEAQPVETQPVDVPPIAAPDAPPDVPATATDTSALEKRIAELEARQRALESPPPPTTTTPTPTTASPHKAEPNKPGGAFTWSGAPGKGVTVSAGDAFSLTLRFRAQLRDTVTLDASGASNEAQVRTLRLITQGNVLSPDLRYTVQLAFGSNDFERDNASPLFDAYVDWVGLRDANLRVGQFFVPFDRARTIREFALQFVDRQQVVRELSLDRDFGIMVSSSDLFGLQGLVGYNLFVGAGDGRNHFGAQPPGPLVIARATLRPFGAFDDDQEADLTRDPRPRLAIAVAGGYNSQTARQGSTVGPRFKLGHVDYAHGAADAVFKWAGLSLLAEGIVRQALQEQLAGDVDGTPTLERTRSGVGWFLQGGFLVHPNVELVGRYEELYALGATDPKLVEQVSDRGRQVAGGLNVYLNGHAFKIQSDAVYLFGDDVTAGSSIVRLQLDASF